MGLFSKKITKEIREILINEIFYKATIIYEKRKNSRVSITKTGINIRIASFLPKKVQNKQIDKFIIWAEKTIIEKDISFNKNQKCFTSGDVLSLFDNDFILEIIKTQTGQTRGKIKGDKIFITVPEKISLVNKDAFLSKIISKLIASHYKDKITNRLHLFNNEHFFGKINNVRLKNNSTNWGSCSSKNNINISIRLFLAPEWVVDYVLIHELSHLKHRNHSKKFWDEVAMAFPKYKEAEKWLKLNAHTCII